MSMVNFQDVCRGKSFVIPENQRGYAWQEEHVKAVFTDLELASDRAHYMGPLIATRTNHDYLDDRAEPIVEFTLDDGQQRLTTLFLIANYIRLQFEAGIDEPEISEEEKRDRIADATELEKILFVRHEGRQPRLKNRNDELNQTLSYLLTGSPAPPARQTPPMRAMRAVADQIERHFRDWSIGNLRHWKNKIVNQAKFIFVNLTDEHIDRYLAFDAINSRGLPLSEFDKIKNFCILIDDRRSLHFDAERKWYVSISHLESFGVGSRANEDAFITEMYSVFHDERHSQGDTHARFVEKYGALLTEGDHDLERELSTFISLWEEYSRSFGFIEARNRSPHYGNLCKQSAGVWLDRLDNMNLATISRPVLVTAHRTLSDREFEEIARACEIYTFRVHAAGRLRKDRNATVINRLAHKILRSGFKEGEILGAICWMIQKDAPMDEFVANLADGKAKYYHHPDVRGWAHCYYFLYEFEIGISPRGVGSIQWASSNEGKINTQEHILPQGHRDGDWWESHWPDEMEAERFVHRLGNLTLTTNNLALGRKKIELKIDDSSSEHSFTAPNATNSEKAIPSYTDGTTWRPENILRREHAMLDFSTKRWAIPCCCDNGQIHLPDEFDFGDGSFRVLELDAQPCVEVRGLGEQGNGGEEGSDVGDESGDVEEVLDGDLDDPAESDAEGPQL